MKLGDCKQVKGALYVSEKPNLANMRYTEARRYIANAKEILREKAGRENGRYSDRKYVQMAGNTAWNGVLYAVNTWLKAKNIERPAQPRPDVEWYQMHLSKHNRKLNKHFTDAYDILHKYLGYDGALDASISRAGLSHAESLISICEKDS